MSWVVEMTECISAPLPWPVAGHICTCQGWEKDYVQNDVMEDVRFILPHSRDLVEELMSPGNKLQECLGWQGKE